jgi:arsenate reductase
MMAIGTVKFFNVSKGFGFISPDIGGGDIFVHASAFQATGAQRLTEGQRVTYDTESDAKGLKVTKLELVAPGEGAAHAAKHSVAMGTPDKDLSLTIYHNPECAASRNALQEIKAAGYEPRIVEYLKFPLTREELKSIAVRMNLPIRDLARKTEPLFGELLLDEKEVGDEELLDAMVEHPQLINRPIVATHNAARLCRPSRMVKAFLAEAARK